MCKKEKCCYGCGRENGKGCDCGYVYQNQGYYRPICPQPAVQCGMPCQMPYQGPCQSPCRNQGGLVGGGCLGGGACNFSTLVILILVLLQFGKEKRRCVEDCCDEDICCEKKTGVDNGILFIIALFYLSCGCK